MSIKRMKFSNRIKLVRSEAGLSQTGFAKAIGVEQQSVSKWENALGFPSLNNISLIVKKYNIRYEWLIDGEEPMSDSKKDKEIFKGIRRLSEDKKPALATVISAITQQEDKTKHIETVYVPTIKKM